MKPFTNVSKGPAADGSLYRCPCCGAHTLSERGGFELCPVCFWEDDGQDDHDADEVRGGPNGSLSLSAARENYRAFGASEQRSHHRCAGAKARGAIAVHRCSLTTQAKLPNPTLQRTGFGVALFTPVAEPSSVRQAACWLDFHAVLRHVSAMQTDAFERSLHAFVRRTPFRPFTVELTSGSSFQVLHPEALAFNGGLAVYISPDGAPSLFDHESVSQLVGSADPQSTQPT